MKLNIFSFTTVFLFLIFHDQLIQTDTPIYDDEIEGMRSDIVRMKQDLDLLNKKNEALTSSKEKQTSFQAHYKDTKIRFGGKYTQEAYVGRYLALLNRQIPNDSAYFIRTTVDYFMDIVFGEYKRPRILVHDTFRFRYKWGSGTDVKVQNGVIKFVDANIETKGTAANKHLIWSREAWIKIALGDVNNDYDHYFKLGIFPFQVGRGISLGAAYQAEGFLGFTPGFSVDQFAPGVLLHMDLVPKRVATDFYVGLLENFNTSFKSNEEIIRAGEIITGCLDPNQRGKRGTNRSDFVVALRTVAQAIAQKNNSIFLEPYIVYVQAVDQKLEFANDSDTFLTTYGMSVEGEAGKFEWGAEGAVNHGEVFIKPWDRNSISLCRNSNGLVEERYTKILNDDPRSVNKPSVTTVTDANKSIVTSGSLNPSLNGQLVSQSADLYNAIDRFRPAERKIFQGFFFVADFSYKFIKEVLKFSFGTGYSSGDLDRQLDVNTLTQKELNNRKFDGFVPIQSVYSGKRLRHLIIFNEGVPRFNTLMPGKTFSNKNVTPAAAPENIEFRNVAFVGARADWHIQAFKEHKVLFAPNLIFYWAPEVPLTAAGKEARNFMGTELMAEISATVFKSMKFYSYVGALFPGTYYTDMRGTVLNPKKPEQTTCNDIAFIANLGLTYSF